MNNEQFKMLVFEGKDGHRTCGTAYFVTETRLITAAHGLNDGAEAFIRLEDSDVKLYPVWVSADPSNIDLAVLEVREPHKFNIQNFDKPSFRERPLTRGEQFESWGYPWASRDNGGDGTSRLAVPVPGSVYSMSHAEARLQIIVSGGKPISPDEWGGISGAPLFKDNTIIGVISEGFSRFHDRLMAQSIPFALSSPEADSLKDALGLKNEREALEEAIAEMTAALEKDEHLLWAFSLAYAKTNSYPGLDAGKLAPARKIAEALLKTWDDNKASRLVSRADLWLVDFAQMTAEASGRMRTLVDKEPAPQASSRWQTAEKLIDVVFRLFSVRMTPESLHGVGPQNHEVALKTPDPTVVELVCAAMDDRPPAYEKLEFNYDDLISKYQVYQAPPGGVSLDPALKAEKVANDLLELLMPNLEPKSSAWKRLNGVLKHLAHNDDRKTRRRYFLQFSSNEQFLRCLSEITELRKKLSWLRFVVLNGGVQEEDPLLSLKDVIFRHQQVIQKQTVTTASSLNV